MQQAFVAPNPLPPIVPYIFDYYNVFLRGPVVAFTEFHHLFCRRNACFKGCIWQPQQAL